MHYLNFIIVQTGIIFTCNILRVLLLVIFRRWFAWIFRWLSKCFLCYFTELDFVTLKHSYEDTNHENRCILQARFLIPMEFLNRSDLMGRKIASYLGVILFMPNIYYTLECTFIEFYCLAVPNQSVSCFYIPTSDGVQNFESFKFVRLSFNQ